MAKKPWKADDCVEFTYARDEGDIVVFARNEKEALIAIRAHGFVLPAPNQLRQTGVRLTDVLAKCHECQRPFT
jgi:hypothetical protein